MEVFEASVQYNDLKGSSAADNADITDAAKWLKQNGHINDEYVVGISMWAGENHGTHQDPVSVKFMVSSLDGYASIPEKLESSSAPLPIRVIRIDMPLADFFALFKRLEITLSSGGLLEGKQFIDV